MLPRTAEVVIIGGGAVGVSTAYHLAALGAKDVVLLEKDALGEGSTGRCAGGARLEFSTAINIQFSQLAFAKLARFAEEVGVDPGFRRIGYLMLATSDLALAQLQRNRPLYAQFQLPVEYLTPEEVRYRWPYIHTEDVRGATYCACDGYLGPHEVVQGYAQAARRLGVRIYQQTPVIDVLVAHGRVQGVRTPQGDIAAPVVLNAAGPYAAVVGRMVGLEIPVKPIRRQVFISGPVPGLPDETPQIIDLGAGTTYRREGEGYMLYGPQDREPSFNTTVDWEATVWACERAAHRLPALAQARIVRGWAGLYEISPDNHAILGPAPGVEGFFLANGFSGHGFMHSPATGQVVAELILYGQARTLDVSPLRLERFAQGTLLHETLTMHT
ncbi:MAG: FAD-dependent oxidoreductase [Candidatus Tectimicrobiota bacterium]|nr:MAG: FAD-dependent oxidoreductase [Candidatus Tectomicrobia bacterium]